MSKRKSTNNFSSILSSLVILMLVVMAVGFLFVMTNNFTTELKNFYVKCGNDTIINDRESFDVVVGKEYKFEVINTLDFSEQGFIVSIYANESEDTNFKFKVDNVETEFAKQGSLSKGFAISTYNDYFKLMINMDLIDMLQIYYPNQTLSNVPTAIDSDIPYFTMAISSKGMAETIKINLNLKSE